MARQVLRLTERAGRKGDRWAVLARDEAGFAEVGATRRRGAENEIELLKDNFAGGRGGERRRVGWDEVAPDDSVLAGKRFRQGDATG